MNTDSEMNSAPSNRTKKYQFDFISSPEPFPGCPHRPPHIVSPPCPFSRDSPAPLCMLLPLDAPIGPRGSPPVQVPPSLPGAPSFPLLPLSPRPVFT